MSSAAAAMLYAHLAEQAGLDVEPCALEANAPVAPLHAWARSGLALLTGEAGQAPTIPGRDYAGRLQAIIDVTKAFAALVGANLDLDARVFAERAAELGLGRSGRISCNGSARLLEASDGWLAVNLAREDDRSAVPAWIGCDAPGDAWTALELAAKIREADEMAAAGQLLGVPAARVESQDDEQWRARWSGGLRAVRIVRMVSDEKRGAQARRRPAVVDLSSLWAGPLCGQLLASGGARVIKVESLRRPDAARSGPPGFFDRLHAGQESVALDFATAEGRAQLARLVARADVVIEGSRPRALEQLGIDLEASFRANPSQVWVSVTAYGRTGPWSNRVGFGDDAAAGGGLVERDAQGRPLFVGDALADPIAGLMAAAGAFAGLCAGGGVLVDVALRESAAFVAGADSIAGRDRAEIVGGEGDWRFLLDGVETPLQPPLARPIGARAAAMGADTAAVLADLL